MGVESVIRLRWAGGAFERTSEPDEVMIVLEVFAVLENIAVEQPASSAQAQTPASKAASLT